MLSDRWPCIPSNTYSSGNLGFLGDNSTIYYQSVDIRILYTYNVEHEEKAAINYGNGEVRDVVFMKDKTFYLTKPPSRK
jgi:hypothetical protein